MASIYKEIEVIDTNSFMGLLASKGQVPGAEGVAVEKELRRTGRLFEVVGRKEAKAISFRIVRPESWGDSIKGGSYAY